MDPSRELSDVCMAEGPQILMRFGPGRVFPCSKFYICIYVSFLPVETCIF